MWRWRRSLMGSSISIRGGPLARRLGYAEDIVGPMPEAVVESFAGVGNPFSLGPIHPGETVVDVGCGSGFDVFIVSKKAGPQGRAIGVDMTPEMVEKARHNAISLGLTNVEFRLGYAEDIPLPDASADVVISNGVINLCPDKDAVFREIYRVMKPGARLMLADIIVHKEVPDSAKRNIDLWTG